MPACARVFCPGLERPLMPGDPTRTIPSLPPTLPSPQVSALLAELAAMRAADPGAKAVVLSSWGRLLGLVGSALQQVWALPAGGRVGGRGSSRAAFGPPAAGLTQSPAHAVPTPPCFSPRSQNGVRYASLAGANPAQREAALHSFLHEPDCAVLTVRARA